MSAKMLSNSPGSKSGFALLMTIVVVGVVIAISLSILELSIKQIRLSTNSKDSEIAFHAAYGGLECARYWRTFSAALMETGQAITPECFDETPDSNTVSEITSGVTGDGEVFLYEYGFTWGSTGNEKCTQITTLVASSTALGTPLEIGDMANLVPGYADSAAKTCGAGLRCTVVSSRGYNRPCSTALGASSFGTVQREVLVQF